MKFDPRYIFQRVVGRALSPFQLEVIGKKEVQNYRKRSTMERLRLAQKNWLTAKVVFDGSVFKCLLSGLADRPYDNALTGGDFVFVKNSSLLRSHASWA